MPIFSGYSYLSVASVPVTGEPMILAPNAIIWRNLTAAQLGDLGTGIIRLERREGGEYRFLYPMGEHGDRLLSPARPK